MPWSELKHESRERLLQSKRALEYVCNYRKIDQGTISELPMGLIDPKSLLTIPDFTNDLIQPLLENPREWLTFFLEDLQEQPLGVELRSIDGKNFYKIYLPRSKVHPPFFGLHRALPLLHEYGEIALVEGAFDLASFACVTRYPVVAFLTKFPTRLQERWLLRWARRIRLFLDNDSDGHSAADRLERRVAKTSVHFTNSRWWEGPTIPDKIKDLNALHQQHGVTSVRFAVQHGLKS